MELGGQERVEVSDCYEIDLKKYLLEIDMLDSGSIEDS